MRRVCLTLLLIPAALAWPSEDEASKLDPKVVKERQRLLDIVRNGENGAQVAAERLAAAGDKRPLLDLLEQSNNSMTVHAVFQGIGSAACRPIVLRRLAQEPDNAVLITLLGNIGAPHSVRNPILLHALKSRSQNTRMSAARALRWIDEVPLSEMRALLHDERDEWVRTTLAVTLLRHGDDAGVTWIANRIRHGKHGGYWVLDQLRSIVGEDGWLSKRIGAFQPLLPDVIRALDTTDSSSARRDAHHVLTRLTRHDWGKSSKKWRTWLDQNRAKPLLHTRARDAAIRDCVVRFQEGLNEINQYYACQVRRGPNRGIEEGVWLAWTNNPRYISVSMIGYGKASPVPPTQVRFVIGFPHQKGSRTPPAYERRLNAQNLVARLTLPDVAPAGERGHITVAQREAIINLARKSLAPLIRHRR